MPYWFLECVRFIIQVGVCTCHIAKEEAHPVIVKTINARSVSEQDLKDATL